MFPILGSSFVKRFCKYDTEGKFNLFLVIFVSGFWLNRSGKPYNVIISTIHKLVALAAGILLLIIIIRASRESSLSTTGLIIGVVTGLLFLANGVTGGLLMTDNPMPTVISMMHLITPFLAALSSAVTLYLLLSP